MSSDEREEDRRAAEGGSFGDRIIVVIEHRHGFMRTYADFLTVMHSGRCSPRGRSPRSSPTPRSKEVYPWDRDGGCARCLETPARDRRVTAGYSPRWSCRCRRGDPVGGGAAIMAPQHGAGKTTLVCGWRSDLSGESGKVLLDGEDITKMAPNRRVKRGLGYVPQGQTLLPADDHVGEPATRHKR